MPDRQVSSGGANRAPDTRQRPKKYRRRQTHYPDVEAVPSQCGFCGSLRMVKSGGTIRLKAGTIFGPNSVMRRERCQDCGLISKVTYTPWREQ